MNTIVVRTDSDASIGSGHFMRCLALAQAWQDAGGRVVFMMAKGTLQFKEHLSKERMDLISLHEAAGSKEDADSTCSLAARLNASWIIVDGYHFGQRYQEMLSHSVSMVAIIDDNSTFDRYHGDLIVNQNIHAQEKMYTSKSDNAHLLIGPSYVLLRREFVPLLDSGSPIQPNVRRILVTLGGGDKNNLTLFVLKVLTTLNLVHSDVEVIVGPNNPNHTSIDQYISRHKLGYRILQNVKSMPKTLAHADLIVSAGGMTLLESAALGRPMVIITTAENQRAANYRFSEIGAIAYGGDGLHLNVDHLGSLIMEIIGNAQKRKFMSQIAKKIVDGCGAKRVVDCMQSLWRKQDDRSQVEDTLCGQPPADAKIFDGR